VIAQLKDKGTRQPDGSGEQIQTVTADIDDSLACKKAEGALVAEPRPMSPTAKAGIESAKSSPR